MREFDRGVDLFNQANKCITKTLFKWSPDYLTAAPLFEKAGLAFRNAKSVDRAIEAYELASTAHNKNGNVFKAGQTLETIAKLILDSKDNGAKAKAYYEKAANMYIERGEFGKAADAVKKGAILMEGYDVEISTKMYMNACDLIDRTEKPHIAVETYRKALAFLTKSKKFSQAIEVMERMNSNFDALSQASNKHKYCVSITIVQLASGDVAVADKTFAQHLQDDSYLQSDQCHLAEDLIVAFKNSNEQMLQDAVGKHNIGFLDNQVGKLVRKLSVFGKRPVNFAAPGPNDVAPSKPKDLSTAAPNESRTLDDALSALGLDDATSPQPKPHEAVEQHSPITVKKQVTSEGEFDLT